MLSSTHTMPEERMRDIIWRTGFTLMIFAALAILGLNASCSPAHHLLEQALGLTPQDQIAGYLAAIARGDRSAALEIWRAPASQDRDLMARRDSVTDALLAHGPSLRHRVLDMIWWRTCCEPAVIDDPTQAGGTRVRVTIGGGHGPETTYVFDLLVPGGYWGDAAGNPLRDWEIVDVYPEGMRPLAWLVEE
jgi:hypothetical protein